MSKRNLDEDDIKVEDIAKRQRCRKRSLSEPLPNETKKKKRDPKKREVLKRLFGRHRCRNMNNQNDHPRSAFEEPEEENEMLDENDDPLLDTVPVNLFPEQLGFLVATQETLRYLYNGGVTPESPLFINLRSRLLRGMYNLASA